MEQETKRQESPFACNMNALGPAERTAHIAAIEEVFGGVKEIRELSDGYSFLMANETSMLLKLADFIAKERLCCVPFSASRSNLSPKGARSG